MDAAGLPALEDAIRHMHGAEPTYLESVPVRETFGERVVWEGEVQVFALKGGRPAPRCYAWSHATTGAKRRFYAVLHVPPVDSPAAAVRASIVADARKR
jgi:hypothetical protein